MFGELLEPSDEALDVMELRLVLCHGFDFGVPGLPRVYHKINLRFSISRRAIDEIVLFAAGSAVPDAKLQYFFHEGQTMKNKT